eukprot:UN03994
MFLFFSLILVCFAKICPNRTWASLEMYAIHPNDTVHTLPDHNYGGKKGDFTALISIFKICWAIYTT